MFEETSDVNTTEPPSQKLVGPEAVITAAVGPGVTVTDTGNDVDVQPFEVIETV